MLIPWKEFAAYEDMSLKDYQISFNMTEYLDFSGSDEASYTSMMKVMAMAAAHDLDVFGGNTAFVNYYGVGEEDNTLLPISRKHFLRHSSST